MRGVLASLTGRLVLTAVGLVVLVALLISVVATAALHAELTHQLDHDLREAAGLDPPATRRVAGPADDRTDDEGDGDGDLRGLGGGAKTIRAQITDTGRAGVLLDGRDESEALGEAALDALADVPADGGVHEISLPGLGDYRVLAVGRGSLGTEVTGLPSKPVDEAVGSLIRWQALLVAVGALVAAAGGVLLVRRQLRPLTEVAATAHRVAALPLAEGAIDLSDRVSERLTDPRTEVGQVGAALNTLLAHVESSLVARHRSEQQVRQFVADASHELRTPLATIRGYTELARRRPDEGTVRTALGKVEEESGRMTALVEDLLLLARLDAGRPLEQAPVDLTRLLVEAVSDARVVGPQHRWRLELPADVPQPVEVTGDAHRLHQVVTNLLTNTRKHTPAGTTVTVTARADGFEVRDDGPGFPPEFVDHAFERFARVDQGRDRSGGAGLGLALVEAIVGSHGGRVALRSQPGDTVVAVRLPTAVAPGGAAVPEVTGPVPQAHVPAAPAP